MEMISYQNLIIKKKNNKDTSSIICVTGPSGYGKTVNLNMMRYFFEMNYKNNEISENKKFFENLNIAKEKINGESYIDHYQGKYPVVYLNFNKFEIKSSYDKTINSFKIFIKLLYKKYNIEIGNLDDDDKVLWKKFCSSYSNIDESVLIYSILFLCHCLNEILKRKIILLIDNYDSPILNTINTEFYDQFYSFYYSIFKTLFENDQENCYLFKTFITGKINSHFFNEFNLVNYTILDDKYIEYFSVTDSELGKLISEFKLKNKSEIFEKCCNNNTLSSLDSTYINNTKEINSYISSSLFNINIRNNNDNTNNNNNDNNNNNSDNGNNNNKKYYDLLSVKNYIQDILNPNNNSMENVNTFFQNYELLNVAFNNDFDYLMIKDMNYILHNEFIEKSIPILSNFKMLTNDYIKK
ncbi:hypothetical protein PIROE2DRAFT_18691 [Piromyces sp. E2]|nr:hypothetical protein PIROE2DRAFT_18691 [Piromyces sp. E2]|eukprot:OUM56612.1 hypothetical protein PIROE2DRAFT_18691 [Piromyces sp. E2]